MSLARNTLVQTGFTLMSRVLGYARDRAISNIIGANPIGDAFATAQMFPNLFRRIFAEGAFSQAFVPVYARTQSERGGDVAASVASQSLSVLLLATVVITIAAQIAMPWIMLVIHGGYADQPRYFNYAILLTQITMPYLAGMSASALFSGVLNTAGRFALSAAAPIFLNLCILAAVLPAPNSNTAALWGAIAIAVAGVVQAALLWWGCRRLGVRIGLRAPKLTPDVKRILVLMGPAVFAGSATQINVFVSQALASFEEGAKSWLYAADRLYQLPLGLIGVAIGVALLPRLSRAVASADQHDEGQALNEAVALSMAFTLPAAAAFLVAPYVLMHGFWTGGQFTDADARATAAALFHYGWGVPAFVLTRILAPPFFARQDTRRPMAYAFASVFANVALGVSFFFGLRAMGAPGYVGLAIATSAAAWVNVILLAGTLLREKTWAPDAGVWLRLARIGLATAVMAVAVWATTPFYPGINAYFSALPVIGVAGKEVATLLICLAGFLLFVAAAFGIRAVTIGEILRAFRRERAAPGEGAALPPGVDA
ncbi:MAG: murein biosynthesis integral membrane protein MurJ [Hyphomonadaceae bacterium]|nr:murein biosynthesis integral membrane protein MurJ [Hyphomonadaceae bacterium]